MRQKPSTFHVAYDDGAILGAIDPITGKPWYRLNWASIKRSMASLAERGGRTVTIINDKTGASLSVSPEGRWE